MNKSVMMVAATATAMALVGSTAAVAGIKGSKHDLGSGGAGQGTTTVTSEVCVFCHTPHGSETAAAVPLWNKALPSGSGYTRYSDLGTATLDGEETTVVGSVSIACLSCHDGTQAMDVVLNAPGSGGYTPPPGAELDPTGIGAMTGAPVPMLGTDLTNDHPIGIEYAGGACTNTLADCTPTAQTGDPDFRGVQYQLLNGKNQWWVDTGNDPAAGLTEVRDLSGAAVAGTPDVREKTDMILYAQTFSRGEGPSVECGSCHDPHVAAPDAAPGAVQQVSFLRIDNNNSNVCLSCHIK